MKIQHSTEKKKNNKMRKNRSTDNNKKQMIDGCCSCSLSLHSSPRSGRMNLYIFQEEKQETLSCILLVWMHEQEDKGTGCEYGRVCFVGTFE